MDYAKRVREIIERRTRIPRPGVTPFPEKPQNKTDSLLPPQKLTDFVGQESVCREIELMLKDVRQRGDVLEHLLLTGPQGIGKATLAYIIAQEIGVNLKRVSGVNVEKVGQLAGLLTSLERDDILFIEEINQLEPEIQEYLYSAMDDFKLNITIDEGPQVVTRRGKDAVVVVAVDEYQRLVGGAPDFKAFLLSAPDLGQLELDSEVRDLPRETDL